MNSSYALVGVLAKVYDAIDAAAVTAKDDIAKHATQCRRALGQRFRKLNRDLHHDQPTQ